MGLLQKFLILIHVVPLIFGLVFVILLETGKIDDYMRPGKPPIEDKYWGPGSPPAKESTSVEKIEIRVPDAYLEDIKRRLQSPRLTPNLENVNFNYGATSAYMETVRQYWLQKYNWRVWEKQINAFPQFKTRIEGLDIHFLHVKPQATKDQVVLPLLLLHGWPGSVFEFYKLIPKLTNRPDSPFVFEVIAPSLPGYGWTEGSRKPGLDVANIGNIFVKLMKRLNFTEPNGYYVQGGDWGSVIGEMVARMHPDLLRGFHTNMAITPQNSMRYFARLLLGFLSPSLVLSANDTWKVYPYTDFIYKVLRETGYAHIQATRPDTVGTALNDSPLGLAAYILEKFGAWTDSDFLSKPDGGIGEHFTLDELLTNVMIYWVTGTITSSLRLYKESFGDSSPWWHYPTEVPIGAAAFPNEFSVCPEPWYRLQHPNLLQYTDMPRGGHFAALEQPQLLADDVFSFVAKAEAYWAKDEPVPGKVKTDL